MLMILSRIDSEMWAFSNAGAVPNVGEEEPQKLRPSPCFVSPGRAVSRTYQPVIAAEPADVPSNFLT